MAQGPRWTTVDVSPSLAVPDMHAGSRCCCSDAAAMAVASSDIGVVGRNCRRQLGTTDESWLLTSEQSWEREGWLQTEIERWCDAIFEPVHYSRSQLAEQMVPVCLAASNWIGLVHRSIVPRTGGPSSHPPTHRVVDGMQRHPWPHRSSPYLKSSQTQEQR